MVKIVYHAGDIGPISLEFFQPLVRVGSAEGNDLVLPHPSVGPKHCQLVLREENVLVCPYMDDHDSIRSDLNFECGIGQQFTIGELVFTVELSGNTVMIPKPRPAEIEASSGATAAPGDDTQQTAPAAPSYYCAHCEAYFESAEITRIGLKGRKKLRLCPRCSRPVGPPEEEAAAAKPWWTRLFSGLRALFGGTKRR